MKPFGVLLLLLGVSGLAHAEDDSLRVRTVALENGMRVLLAPDARAPGADVAVWYRAGSRFDKIGASGTSYLFGRLMFGGSRGFAAGEHRRLLQAEGASPNFVVNPDYTCLYQALAPEAVDLALRLEADRMAGLDLSQARLDADRAAVIAERRGRLGSNPIARGLERLYATAFAGNPYGRPVIGLEEDLRRITLEDARSFYGERYAPQNAVLTVVGRFDPEASLATIRRTFGALPRRPSTPPPATKPAAQRAERRAHDVTTSPGPILLVGWRGPGAADPDRPALDLMAHILWGGPSSQLQRSLPRDAFVNTQGDFDPSQEGSLFLCIAALRAGADTARAERLLVSEVEGLASQPLSATRLEGAKRQLELSRLFGWQTARGRAESLGAGVMLEGSHRAAAAGIERVRAITPASLQRAAAKFLKASGRTVVWMTPSGTPGGAQQGGGQ